MRERVTELDAERFVDLFRTRITCRHQLLQLHELLRKFHICRQVNSDGGQQPAGTLLREVLYSAAFITRPLVDRGRRSKIHRHKRELVQPVGQIALWITETSRDGSTHGHPDDRVLIQGHRSSERSHVAVVQNFERNTPGSSRSMRISMNATAPPPDKW